MATVPGQLIWEIVKTNNCFLVKQFGRGNAKVQFSKETNNLCNLNSYKHSGLANKKTVTIQAADKEQGVVLATTKTKKQNKPKVSVNKSILKKEFPRMSKTVANQVVDNYYRPDLKKFALARLSVISKSLRVAKSVNDTLFLSSLHSLLSGSPTSTTTISPSPSPGTMIPYATIEEASLALGRNLTTLETLWFDYSATKSDYYLYCHNILFLFLIFSLVPLPLVFVELARSASGWFDRYKIQPKVKNSFSDMFRCYRDVMKMFILVVGPLQLVSYPSIQMIEIRSGLPLPSFGEIAAQLVVYFLVEDYTNYWVHRFFHSKWGYEKIHHIHHEYTAPIGYAAPYAHWAEVLLLGVPTFLGPAIAPGHMITFWLWIALRQIEAIETHSGYDFPWTLTKFIPFYGGAEYHDYHHYVGGQSQSNFASVFTYCDYIYGTDKGYRFQKKLLQQIKQESKKSNMQNGGDKLD